MIELNVQQGSEAWLKARAKCFTASEASAMMGVSSYMKRSELIKQKATGIVPEVDSATQSRFDAGHAAEAAARPLAEAIIGAELYPLVATDDSGKYLASSDGVASNDGAITFLPIGFEHKLFNESLAAKISAGDVPESHKWQLVHQTLVFGFERILFVVSDGTSDRFAYCWFSATEGDIKKLMAGWDQLEKDLAEYVHEEVKPILVAEPVKDLPAVTVQVSGSVSVVDNFSMFEVALRDFVENKLVRRPQTDQDFVDLDQQIKSLKKAEDALDAAEAQMIAQVASVDSMKRTKDMLHKLARDSRLIAERLLKAEKENRKAELVAATNKAANEHYSALAARVGVQFSIATVSFASEIAGLKSLASMKEKLSVALANAKVEANAIADRIEANRKTVEDMTLFPDFQQVCQKQPDDFAALMAMRISQRQAQLDAERERIRAEEQAKAEAAARKQAQEAADKADRERIDAMSIVDAALPETIVIDPNSPMVIIEMKPANDHIVESNKMVEQQADTGKTMKLGEICAALGFTMTADFLASLGIHPVRTEKAARLYDANKFSTICRLISEHVMSLAFKKAA